MSEQDQNYNEALQRARAKRRAEKRRRFIIKQRIFYGVCLAILVLIIVLIVAGCNSIRANKAEKKAAAAAQAQAAEEAAAQQEAEESKAAEPQTATATLAAVGDIMVYDEQISAAKQSDGTYDFTPCFDNVRAQLVDADLTVGNLELNFAGEPYSGYPTFSAPDSLATALSSAGFDILQTANTYSIQNGISGLESTMETITDAGMDYVGTGISDDGSRTGATPVVKEVNGIRIAFIAFTKGCNNMSLPSGYEDAVDLLYTDYYTNYSSVNESGILAAIQNAKDTDADIIIAMVHWGSEYETNPSSTQEEIADLMFKNGVDVILGSHSHIVGGMEQRTVTTVDGESRDVFLAYSLGNFLSSQNADYTQDSVILNMTFTKDLDSGDTVISNVSYTPVYIEDAGTGTPGRYILLDIYEEINDYVSAVSGCVDTETYDALNDAISVLHSVAGESLDAQVQAEKEAEAAANPTGNPAGTDGTSETGEDSSLALDGDETDDSSDGSLASLLTGGGDSTDTEGA